MSKKVITIGSATHDIFIEFDDPYMLHLHLKDRDQSFIALEEGKKITWKDGVKALWCIFWFKIAD